MPRGRVVCQAERTRREAPRPRPVAIALDGSSTLARRRCWPRSSAVRPARGDAASRRASPSAERDGVVTVACAAAVWAQELDLMAELVVARLNAASARSA